MHSSSIKTLAAALLTTFAFAGCGGGGGGTSASGSGQSAGQAAAAEKPAAAVAPVTTTLSGVFEGQINNSQPLTSLLQADGSYFLVYSDTATPPKVSGAVIGTGALNNSSFTSSNATDLNLIGTGSQTPSQGSLSASYNPSASFNGNLSFANGNRAFTGTYNNSFNTLPALSSLQGEYTGDIGTKDVREEIKLTIDANGNVTGALTCGCKISATLQKRDDGRSYVATVEFVGGTHPLANKAMAGNVYLDSVKKRLYIVGHLGTGTEGAIFVGTKN